MSGVGVEPCCLYKNLVSFKNVHRVSRQKCFSYLYQSIKYMKNCFAETKVIFGWKILLIQD